MSDRTSVVAEIGRILDTKCQGCNKALKVKRKYGDKPPYATEDQYCLHDCPIGARLQELGKQLGKGLSTATTEPRRRRREWMLGGIAQ